jgi:hypothetical protein
MSIVSNQRFLYLYSGVLTVSFVVTTFLGFSRGNFALHHVSATEQKDWRLADFDQLTVHRINVVEPNGTPRLIISDKAEFDETFYHGQKIARPRNSAGMLFINDEGTEDGGLLFGGYKSKDGTIHSYGHLSFDEYDQDQALSQDMQQEGQERKSAYQINDNDTALLTPEVTSAYRKVHAMAEGPEKKKAMAAVTAKYHAGLYARASIERDTDKSAALRLRDPEGRTRILLRVAADGTPTMQFMDATGKVTRQWSDTPTREKK